MFHAMMRYESDAKRERMTVSNSCNEFHSHFQLSFWAFVKEEVLCLLLVQAIEPGCTCLGEMLSD